MRKCLFILCIVTGLTGCVSDPLKDYDPATPTTLHDVSVEGSHYPEAQVQRGKYLAELLACGTCHTDRALIGEPDARRVFAGSGIGIAYSNPLTEKNPGVVYPSNITNDIETGLGKWEDDEIVEVIRTGIDNHGRRHLSVMPWPGYSRMTNEDATAIVAFLRSLKVVNHKVPDNVVPGKKATAPFVHFGVYRSKR